MSARPHRPTLARRAFTFALLALVFTNGCATPVYDYFDLEDEMANVIGSYGADLDAAAVGLRAWLVANEPRIRETSLAAKEARAAASRDGSSRKTFNAGWSVRQERGRQLVQRLDPQGRWYTHAKLSRLLQWFVSLEGPVPAP